METPSVKKTKETKVLEEPYFTVSPEKKQNILDRFWSRVDKKGPKECWEWEGSLTSNGYGELRIIRTHSPRCHRLAWVIQYNALIPKGLHVCHRCDNKACCNVDHLFLGTNATNMYDRDLKGRSNANKRFEVKISLIDKNKIIIKKLSSPIRFSDLARKYKVRHSTVQNLVYTFFSKPYDKSWLPEPLKTRYAHCKSWKEVKALKEKYDLEDASSKNKGTQPL
jgi:hypothetical protein